MSVRLAQGPFAPEQELAAFRDGLAGEGAVASFIGLARPASADGRPVDRLLLEHHPRLTLPSLEAVAEAARTGFGIAAVRIVHRVGEVAPGDAIVFVAAAAVHRRAAFEAADYMMDRLKTDALFWKREDGADGSRWIEPGDEDYAARRRWSETCPE
jgi:molybdopterin synthase catalytic subunit